MSHPAEGDRPYVVNPEAIGDPNLTPILQHSVADCPAHSDDWLYSAVRNNRRLSGMSPQGCSCLTCVHGEPEGECATCAACAACRGECGICPYVIPTASTDAAS